MSDAAILPRIRTLVVCDQVLASDIEAGVFTLEGVRQHLEFASFPHVAALNLFLVLSSPRRGDWEGKVLLIDAATDMASATPGSRLCSRRTTSSCPSGSISAYVSSSNPVFISSRSISRSERGKRSPEKGNSRCSSSPYRSEPCPDNPRDFTSPLCNTSSPSQSTTPAELAAIDEMRKQCDTPPRSFAREAASGRWSRPAQPLRSCAVASVILRGESFVVGPPLRGTDRRRSARPFRRSARAPVSPSRCGGWQIRRRGRHNPPGKTALLDAAR